MLDGAVVDEEPIKHSDVLVEDPEEVEKHAKKLEYSTKSLKKLARLSEELKNPSSNCLSRLWRSKKENFFVKVLKQKLKQRLKQKKLLTKLTGGRKGRNFSSKY